MTSLIAITLAIGGIILGGLAFGSTSRIKMEERASMNEVVRLKKELTNMYEKVEALRKEQKELAGTLQRLQEASINGDMQELLNVALKNYKDLAMARPEAGNIGSHEKAKKLAGEKVIKICNEVCEHFISEDLSKETFDNIYKPQLTNIMQNSGIKAIYETLRDRYPYIEKVPFDGSSIAA